MKKDLDWLVQRIHSEREQLAQSFSEGKETEVDRIFNDGKEHGLLFVSNRIDELDEPEVLSQEWIDEHEEQEEMYGTYGVPVRKLENLLVPKQEEVDQAYKDGYEKGKQHTFYKGYLEGLGDKENEPETVADVVTAFWKSYERLKEAMSMEVEEMEE